MLFRSPLSRCPRITRTIRTTGTARTTGIARIPQIAPIVALIAVFCACADSAWSRTFDWVVVDPSDVTSNPAFLQSSLGLTPSGEPVRASLVFNRGIFGSNNFGDYRIEHRDRDGNVIWSTLLEGKVHVKNVRVDSEGAIVVHGSYEGSIQVGPHHQLVETTNWTREFLLSFAPDRSVNWLIDPSVADPGLRRIDALVIDASDRIWIGFATVTADAGIKMLNADGSVAQTWAHEGALGTSGLAVDPDGTVWAAGPVDGGFVSFNGFESFAPHDYNAYLVKYASGGAAQWVQFVEDVTFQFPSVVSDGSGHAYMAGDLNGVFAFGDLIPEGIDWVHDFFLVKVDSDGTFVWLREVPLDTYAGDGGAGAGAILACPDPDRIIFAGFSRLSVDWGRDDNPPPSYGSEDVLVLEYSADGEFQWAKTAGAGGYDVVDAVAADAQGNVFIAGEVSPGSHFDEQQFGGAFMNFFLASLPAGETSSVSENEESDDGGSALGARVQTQLINTPNPFRPDTSIRFRLAEAGSVRLRVYDSNGARVATLVDGYLDARDHAVSWDGRDDAGRAVPSGVYQCRLETATGVATRSMTVIR